MKIKENEYLTEEEVLIQYSMIFTKSNLYRACRYNNLPFYKNGRKKFFKKSELILWIDSKKVEKREKTENKIYLSEKYGW